MSKVEEKALEALDWYAPKGINEQVGLVYTKAAVLGMFKDGYRQAEKDLELSWEDISKIISIDQQVCGTMGISHYTYYHQQAMEEVLNRFKDYKK